MIRCVLLLLPLALPAQAADLCPDAGTLARIGGPPREVAGEIAKTCHPGDRIILPTFASGLIAMVCDENKPVIPAGHDLICTYSGRRPT